MNNVEKLEQIRILGEVRQRLGADDKNDEKYDDDINEMSNHNLIRAYTGWNLGDGSWWDSLKGMFDDLEEIDNSEKPNN